ncbi:actin-related protein 2/3 complex, subunit 5 [Brevipalpus obovatus]|uniref:actin-related protein 2/3 complex, subunit 5 n=1 Tax=Brevipalpus obovatus TaxID=246614 RepID=UPI003D9E4913
MASSVTNTFRRLDVDQLNEDLFKDEEANELSSPTSVVDEKEILKLSSSGRHLEAIQAVLALKPQASTNPSVKETAFNLMMQLMTRTKAAEIGEIISKLDVNQIDLVMKYIYKGFENPVDGSSAVLLVWHQKAFEKGGHGSIVRVLTDWKRV